MTYASKTLEKKPCKVTAALQHRQKQVDFLARLDALETMLKQFEQGSLANYPEYIARMRAALEKKRRKLPRQLQAHNPNQKATS